METVESEPRQKRRRFAALGGFVLGVLLTVAAAAVALLIFVYSGTHNVAASEPEGDLATWLLDTTLTRSVEERAEDIVVPDDLEARAAAGEAHYNSMCLPCHAAPGVEQSEMARGMTPQPPEIDHIVNDWRPSEMFWIAKHGIKMTGMPAWGEFHTDEEIWNIVAYMESVAGQDLNDQAVERKEAREAPDEAPAQPAGGDHGHGGHTH